MESDGDDKLRVLTSTPHELHSGMIVAALEREGIRARAAGALTAGFRAEAPGWVKILVFEEDLERARDVLRNVETDEEPIDWSQVDVGDPEDE